MSAFDALSVWSAVEFQANRARLSAVQMRVLHAVLNQTVRYQRLSVPISRSRMALLADVHGNNLAACLDVLEMSGFVNHSPGVGRRLTVVTLVVPEDWERHEQDSGRDPGPRTQATTPTVASSTTSEVAEVTTSNVATSATPDVATSATSTVVSDATSAVAGVATRTGREYEEKVTRSADGEGPRAAVAALRAVPDAHALSLDPNASAEGVASSFFDAMKSAGAPVVNTGKVLQGIRQAGNAGYAPRAVMMGLGFWIAEGEMYPSQIGERCQMAVLAGGPPLSTGVDDLLREGQQRFAVTRARRNMGPSAADVREARTQLAAERWQRKPKGQNPWA
ncbi:hypothetical protein [Luteococcus sanguinis]|uniref:MarR family transcriptional regulator n=1 Tax=Luteococcus sanguinis TaxID=174038 RepID=A0ABW1X5X9_9ACTN